MSVAVFPNPTTDGITIRIATSVALPLAFSLHNAQGLPVLLGKATTRDSYLDLTAFPGGMYTLHFANGNVLVVVRQ